MTKDQEMFLREHFGIDDEDFTEEQAIELMDEMVHDTKAGEAAEINNGGLSEQMDFLFGNKEQRDRKLYEKLYKDELFDSFEDCRIRIPGERFWGKVVPVGTLLGQDEETYIINNIVLDPNYQWQDVLKSKNPSPDDILYRRWIHKFWFNYDPVDDKEKSEENLAERQAIFDALKPLGHPGFLINGKGYLLIAEDMEWRQCFDNVDAALRAIDIIIEKPEWAK